MSQNLNYLIDQVSLDKGIERSILVRTLEEAMLKAAQRKVGLERELEARFNESNGEVELFEFKTVVEEVANPDREIPLAEARAQDPDVQPGDLLGFRLDIEGFGRISAQIAKQVIIQRIKNAERELIYNDYKDREGEIITGTVRRIERAFDADRRGHYIVDLGRTEGILKAQDQSPREKFRPGDRISALIRVVHDKPTKGPQIELTRKSKEFLLKLFEQEVPEMAEGVVVAKSVAREPGVRSKIAVYSNHSDVDPLGACVGMKGTRVQNIVQELRNEKIDIVPYHPDQVRFVCNALLPAKVSQVIIDEASNTMEITVPDDQLSLAIGKRGQNVRLASKLTGWRIDIHSESKIERISQNAKGLFQMIEGVDEGLAGTLTKLGFVSLKGLAAANREELRMIPGVSEELANRMVDGAAGLLASVDGDEEVLVDRLPKSVTSEQEEFGGLDTPAGPRGEDKPGE